MASFSFGGAAQGCATCGGGSNFSFNAPAPRQQQQKQQEQQHTLQGKKFKLVLLGDGAVGKTAYIRKLMSDDFIRHYCATLGVEVRCLDFLTNRGHIKFNVWDCAGQEKFGGLRDGYYIKGQCAIIMFDVTARITYKHVPNWYRDLARVCGTWERTDCEKQKSTSSTSWYLGNSNTCTSSPVAFDYYDREGNKLVNMIPVVLVGNKVDVRDRKVTARSITFHRRVSLPYYDISTKSNYNLEKPLLWLSRKIAQDPDLEFVESPQDTTRRLMADGEWESVLQTLPNDATELNCYLATTTRYERFLMDEMCKMSLNRMGRMGRNNSAAFHVLTHILDRCPERVCIPAMKDFVQQDGVPLDPLVTLLRRRDPAAVLFYKSIITKDIDATKDVVLCKALRFIDHDAFVEFCCISRLYHTPDVLQIVQDFVLVNKVGKANAANAANASYRH